MNDILKKPVHIALIPPTQIQELRKSKYVEDFRYTSSIDNNTKLPQEEKARLVPKLNIPKFNKGNPRKRVMLKVLYDQIPEPIQDPPCNSCVAACCRMYVIDLTKEEYESGIFDPYAVEVTKEISEQLHSSSLLVGQILDTLSAATVTPDGKTRRVLDKQVGEPCPFLTNDDKCGIYDDRPYICRAYSCLDDKRITDDHRNGIHPDVQNF